MSSETTRGEGVSVRGRLRALEREVGELPCASCGLRPDGPGVVVYGRQDEPQECASCGGPLHFAIEVSGSGDNPEPGVLMRP